MAKFDCEIPSDFVKQLAQLADDKTIFEIMDKSVPIIVKSVKKECKAHRRTASMENSVKQTVKAKKTKTNAYITVVRPSGKDTKGVRNMEKMAHIEYGTKHQPATPILTKAIKDCEKQVLSEMQRLYEEEIQ